MKQFDKDGDGYLNLAERKAAREWLAKNGGARRPRGRGGFGGPGGSHQTPTPGAKVSPADVLSFSAASLYDLGTLRTLFLDFEEPDWEKELADFYHTDVEVPARLTVDGHVYSDVGVHFRGNTSFFMVPEGSKRSLNLSLDLIHAEQNLLGYRTLNLLNSHEDPSFLRSVMYYQLCREYIPAPKANFVRLVINGENWGVYVNVQQFNKEFMKEWFGAKGARWKVPGSPNGRGGFNYLGADPAPYKRIYEIKTKDDPKAWADLIRLCQVLNETPADKLEAALAPLLDIDATVKFLALDNLVINNDGFWTRASDYDLAQDSQGRFHLIPYDANETFNRPEGPGMGGGPPGPGRFGLGSPSGRDGFGPGMMLARPMFEQADQDRDDKVAEAEFAALADKWFDQLDPQKHGQVSLEQFSERLGVILRPPGGPAGFGPPGGSPPVGDPGLGAGRSRFGPPPFLTQGLFRAADANKDGTLARAELKDTFAKWFRQWDTAHNGSLSQDQLASGLRGVLPPTDFAGRGGFRGGPPGGPGFRGRPRINGVELDPLIAASDSSKALAVKLFAVLSLRARYLACVHEMADKWLDWNRLGPVARQHHNLIAADVKADTRKLDSLEDFEASLEAPDQAGDFGPRRPISFKSFADQRRAYLLKLPQAQAAIGH